MTDITFATREEAIAFIIDAIEAGGAANARTEYDINAIADELVTKRADETPEGATIASSLRFSIDADTGWDAIVAHELIGPITAELTSINTPALIDGRATTTDTITITRDGITRNGIEIDAIDVESSEDAEPYDRAVRSIIGDQPFTWIS